MTKTQYAKFVHQVTDLVAFNDETREDFAAWEQEVAA